MGILGALSYALFERRFGVRKTGLLGLTCQQICLIAAVVSIWLPGSPFDPKTYFFNETVKTWSSQINQSFSDGNTAPRWSNNKMERLQLVEKDVNNMTSIITFLSGIATARFGLWMADLSIIHIMQEGVPECDRNTVFGVHNALCQTFSVLKDVLVIILPAPSTFGICILISYSFITTGYLFFIYYLIKYSTDIPIRSYIARFNGFSPILFGGGDMMEFTVRKRHHSKN
ncbi:hypothetical protein KIN20_037128 [Parelaphostrongylus tenuis]|uniref:Solute carrier family 40 member n=1 Tax=Parelaphostrongylus tenuis TaxID=148309 RepID=A0AAD5RDI3_PARTN|nr:hypothetical protein KIN20_037128 [Parelaphostrongylus tenuis]